MSQQHMNFDESHQTGPGVYAAGYEQPQHFNDTGFETVGQKLSARSAQSGPTSGQRLALAIVSIVTLLLCLLCVVILLAVPVSPDVANNFAPVMGIAVLGLFTAVIVINVVFNRKR